MIQALMAMGAALLLQAGQEGEESGRVVSSDGMVVVSGSEQRTCGAVLSLVTQLRTDLQSVLGKNATDAAGVPVEHKVENPIYITLVGNPGDPEPSRLFVRQPRRVEGMEGFRIELLVHLARGLNKQDLEHEVIECVLLEMGLHAGLREDSKIGLPPFLAEGVQERIAWHRGEGDRGLYRALYERGLVLEVEDVLTRKSTRGLDAAQRTAFRVSSGALVRAMLEQPGGQQSFGKLVEEAASFEGDFLGLLRKHFPETGLSDDSLAKWWALQLANLTQDFVTDTMDLLASEAALREVLSGTLDDEDGEAVTYRLEDYHRILELEEGQRKILLGGMGERLGIFSYRCFPSYQPMTVEYASIMHELLEGRDDDLIARLTVLQERRDLLSKAGEHARDYLDWFVINTASELSGEFEDYMKVKRELEVRQPATDSPVESYLDGMQKFYDE